MVVPLRLGAELRLRPAVSSANNAGRYKEILIRPIKTLVHVFLSCARGAYLVHTTLFLALSLPPLLSLTRSCSIINFLILNLWFFHFLVAGHKSPGQTKFIGGLRAVPEQPNRKTLKKHTHTHSTFTAEQKRLAFLIEPIPSEN